MRNKQKLDIYLRVAQKEIFQPNFANFGTVSAIGPTISNFNKYLAKNTPKNSARFL